MFLELFSYGFMQRALLAGVFVAASCAGLGVFLVLRRFSMIGDGLAHVGFASVALAFVLGLAPMAVSIPLVMLLSLGILRLGGQDSLFGETAIALVSSFAVALGVLFASVSKGFNVDLFSYLFGSILAITEYEVWLSVILSAAVVLIVRFYYHDLFAVTYDEDFAKVSGVKTARINRLLILLTALTVVLGIRVVGTLLVSSLITFPPVIALQLSRGFRSTILLSLASAVFSVVTGIVVAFLFDLPAGATIVMVNVLLLLLAYGLRVLAFKDR